MLGMVSVASAAALLSYLPLPLLNCKLLEM